MSPELQQLHRLCCTPGAEMAVEWWAALGLAQWRDVYERHPGVRPALDQLIAQRLGYDAVIPPLSAPAEAFLQSAVRRELLCLVLGLWALRSPDYLLMRCYRQVLLAHQVPVSVLKQLQVLAPQDGRLPLLPADELPQVARALGCAWISHASDKALALCRLYWPPSQMEAPEAPLLSVVSRLLKWL